MSTNPAEHTDQRVIHTQSRMRLRLYIGEDKMHAGVPLYRAIVLKARQLQMAGATVFRGSLGYGRSTRMRSTEVTFSEDLPVVVEVVDAPDRIHYLLTLIDGLPEIGLATCEPVSIISMPPAGTSPG